MPALTKRQIHPIAQIVLDDPGHRPELLLDPLRYQTMRGASVSASATIRPPLDNRLATVAAWLDCHCLHRQRRNGDAKTLPHCGRHV